MNNFYKSYEDLRIKNIFSKKLGIQNANIKKKYFYSYFILIFVFISIPFAYNLVPFIYSFSIYQFSETLLSIFYSFLITNFSIINNFSFYKIPFICTKVSYISRDIVLIWSNIKYFMISGIISITASYFILRYFIVKRISREYATNNIYIGLFIILKLIVPVFILNLVIITIVIYVAPDMYKIEKLIVLFIYNLLGMWIIFVYTLLYRGLEIKTNSVNKQEKKNNFVHIYWFHLIKYIFINNPSFAIGTIIYFGLSISVFIIIGKDLMILEQHLFRSVAYYSFLITGLLLTINPILSAVYNLSQSYHNYSTHILNNRILPSLNKHLLIIGFGNLGKLLIRNCFADIHPESYGTIQLDGYKNMNSDSIKDLSDYDIIIDRNLQLHLVSRRIVFIENNRALFETLFKDIREYPVGVLAPWGPKDDGITIAGICGDAKDSFVLEAVNPSSAEIIINSTPDSTLSLYLAKTYENIKQILSVSDTSTFDSLTSTTYDKSIFPIDTNLVEGISISQRIIQWIGKTYNKVIRDEIKYSNAKDFLSKNGKILLVGDSKVIFYIVQSLWLTFKFLFLGKNDIWIKKHFQEKFIVFSDDEDMKKEHYRNRWKFYPIRHSSTRENDFISLRAYFGKIVNFEKYIEVLNKEKPSLILLITDKKYKSISMIVRAMNAIEVVYKNKLKKELPQILIFSHREDKYFLEEQFRKYFTYNLKRNRTVGFPSQSIKESRISKDFVTANQFSSMIRSMIKPRLRNNSLNNMYANYSHKLDQRRPLKSLKGKDNGDEFDDFFLSNYVAEITFSCVDRPGSLAFLLNYLLGKKLIFPKNGLIKIPNFIFYYSFQERRFRNTFIFTGTARLNYYKEIKNINEILIYCLINCDENYRRKFLKMINDNFELGEGENRTLWNEIIDSGMFSNYPISCILRHPNRYQDVWIQRPRIIKGCFDKLKPVQFKKTEKDLYEKAEKDLFDTAHFKIWSDGQNIPGSLATALSKIILSDCIDGERKPILIPHIEFSTNRPATEVVINKKNLRVAQDSIYIGLCNANKFRMMKEKKQNTTFTGEINHTSQDLIRAIKIKLGGILEISKFEDSFMIFDKTKWVEYAFNLLNHLNSFSNSYSLYIILKNYVEGTNEENRMFENTKFTGVTEFSLYKRIIKNSKRVSIIKNGFWIIKNWVNCENSRDDIGYHIMPERENSNNKNLLNEKFQSYELAIIRKELLDNYLNLLFSKSVEENYINSKTDKEQEKYKNMLCFIDDL